MADPPNPGNRLEPRSGFARRLAPRGAGCLRREALETAYGEAKAKAADAAAGD
jgi:hypothetical protein